MFRRASFFDNQACKLITLPVEGSSLGEPRLSSSRLAKHGLAAGVHHQSLIVAEQSFPSLISASFFRSTMATYTERHITSPSFVVDSSSGRRS